MDFLVLFKKMWYTEGNGRVSEWLKEHAWKACRLARVSQVRILSLPPEEKNIEIPPRGDFMFSWAKPKQDSPLLRRRLRKTSFSQVSSLEANPVWSIGGLLEANLILFCWLKTLFWLWYNGAKEWDLRRYPQ